jgi:hypothetical protein
MLTAITETLDCSLRTHAHDAELLALKPELDMALEAWWAEHSVSAAASYCFGRKSWFGNIDSLGSWMTTGVCSEA